MESLNNYVDFWQYCNTLSEITNVDIDNVIKIVRGTFEQIDEGSISSEFGFRKIERDLTMKAHRLTVEAARRSKALTRMGEIPASSDYSKRLRA